MALPFTDNCTNTDGVAFETHNANWTMVGNVASWAINDNAVYADNPTVSFARWDGDVFNNDQYSEAIVVGVSGTDNALFGVGCRIDTAGEANANRNGYVFVVRGVFSERRLLSRSDGGSYTTLNSDTTAISVNDVIRIEAEGTTIRTKVNDVEIFSETDATYGSGAAGLASNNANTTDSRLDDVEVGNLGAAANTRRYSLSLTGVG